MAIKTMLELLNLEFPIKEADRLKEIFAEVDTNILNGVSFLPLDRLLDLKPYRCSLLRGLIPSMGSFLLKLRYNLFSLTILLLSIVILVILILKKSFSVNSYYFQVHS